MINNIYNQKLAKWDRLIIILSIMDILMALIIQAYIKVPYMITFFRFNSIICFILLIEALNNLKNYKKVDNYIVK